MLVQLDQFEGPLGLLLYLIRKEEMDIYDIPIHRITSQYLTYIKQLPQFDLEQAGEFVAMAATLIQIKAKMLLPNYDENGEEIEEEDPRKPLVQQLLEYQKYQDASKELYERDILGRDTWKRGRKEDIPTDDGGIELEESALFSLIACYRSVVKKAAKAQHRVAAKFQTIADRILEIAVRIKPGKKITLKEIMDFDKWTHTRYLITFLSTLELGKLGYVKLSQYEDCGDLHIEGTQEISGDVVMRVAEYDDGTTRNEEPVTPAVSPEAEEKIQQELEPQEDEIASNDDILAAEAELKTETCEQDPQMAEAVQSFESSSLDSGIDIDAINKVVEESLDKGGVKVDTSEEVEMDAQADAEVELTAEKDQQELVVEELVLDNESRDMEA